MTTSGCTRTNDALLEEPTPNLVEVLDARVVVALLVASDNMFEPTASRGGVDFSDSLEGERIRVDNVLEELDSEALVRVPLSDRETRVDGLGGLV